MTSQQNTTTNDRTLHSADADLLAAARALRPKGVPCPSSARKHPRPSRRRFNRTSDALAVFVTDNAVRALLRIADPKALQQARDALGLSDDNGNAEPDARDVATSLRAAITAVQAAVVAARSAMPDDEQIDEALSAIEGVADGLHDRADAIDDALADQGQPATFCSAPIEQALAEIYAERAPVFDDEQIDDDVAALGRVAEGRQRLLARGWRPDPSTGRLLAP
jgi:hypothetical protein